MPRTVRPKGSTATSEQLLVLYVVVGLVLFALGAWLPIALARPTGYTGGNPITISLYLVTGRIHWTLACTLWLLAELLTCFALVALGWFLTTGYRGRRTRVDIAAHSMARPKDIEHLTGERAAATARRLQPDLKAVDKLDPGHIGPVLLRDLRSGQLIHASVEDNATILAGPRQGKTVAVAIPAVAAHPGPTVVTGNKRDILDDTRGVREVRGDVWLFDPQQIIGGRQTWWFNPLADVTTMKAASRVAAIFAASERDPGAKVDAHFDTAAKELIARLILAAAASGKTLVDVYRWAMNPNGSNTAVRLLEQAGRSSDAAGLYELAAEELSAARNEPDKMRGSTFGTARTMLGALADPDSTRWVTPQPGLPALDVPRFVQSTDSLYLLTEGGPGSPAPLVALLTASVMEAAKTRANASPAGRLPRPLLCVLDEAANICRIPDLPRWYSHFGSRGLLLITILQTYAQGRMVWGEDGMNTLWGATNHALYLGGGKDAKFLENLSQLIGEHDVTTVSRSSSSGLQAGTSVSASTRKERILSVAQLAALPRGRAVLIASGTPAILGATVHWKDGPYAEEIQASHDRYTPADQATATLPDLPPSNWVDLDPIR